MHCSACGTQLDEGVQFCGHCGTVNVPVAVAPPLIAQAPASLTPTGSAARAVVVESGRTFDGKVAPIVVGQRTTLDGAEDAVKAEAIPWDVAQDKRATRHEAKRPQTASLICMVLAALLTVPSVAGFWVVEHLGDANSTAEFFAPIHRKVGVADALGSAIADRLVERNFVAADRRSEAAAKASRFIQSRAFDRGWTAAIEEMYVAEWRSEAATGMAFNVTPIVDHLREDGVAVSRASLAPIPVMSPAARKSIQTVIDIAALVALICGLLAFVLFLVGIVKASRRANALRWFATGLFAASLFGLGVALGLPGVLVGKPSSHAVKPVLDGFVSMSSSGLGGVVALLGLVAVLLGLVAAFLERRAMPKKGGLAA